MVPKYIVNKYPIIPQFHIS